MAEVEPPINERTTKQVVRQNDLVDCNADQVRDYATKWGTKSSDQMIKLSDQVIESADEKNVGNDVGNGGNGCR